MQVAMLWVVLVGTLASRAVRGSHLYSGLLHRGRYSLVLQTIVVWVVLVSGTVASSSATILLESYQSPPDVYDELFEPGDDAGERDYTQHASLHDQTVIRGQYSVRLPDGRTQVVKYTADDNGFHPVVSYSGEAKYPEDVLRYDDPGSYSYTSQPFSYTQEPHSYTQELHSYTQEPRSYVSEPYRYTLEPRSCTYVPYNDASELNSYTTDPYSYGPKPHKPSILPYAHAQALYKPPITPYKPLYVEPESSLDKSPGSDKSALSASNKPPYDSSHVPPPVEKEAYLNLSAPGTQLKPKSKQNAPQACTPPRPKGGIYFPQPTYTPIPMITNYTPIPMITNYTPIPKTLNYTPYPKIRKYIPIPRIQPTP